MNDTTFTNVLLDDREDGFPVPVLDDDREETACPRLARLLGDEMLNGAEDPSALDAMPSLGSRTK